MRTPPAWSPPRPDPELPVTPESARGSSGRWWQSGQCDRRVHRACARYRASWPHLKAYGRPRCPHRASSTRPHATGGPAMRAVHRRIPGSCTTAPGVPRRSEITGKRAARWDFQQIYGDNGRQRMFCMRSDVILDVLPHHVEPDGSVACRWFAQRGPDRKAGLRVAAWTAGRARHQDVGEATREPGPGAPVRFPSRARAAAGSPGEQECPSAHR